MVILVHRSLLQEIRGKIVGRGGWKFNTEGPNVASNSVRKDKYLVSISLQFVRSNILKHTHGVGDVLKNVTD